MVEEILKKYIEEWESGEIEVTDELMGAICKDPRIIIKILHSLEKGGNPARKEQEFWTGVFTHKSFSLDLLEAAAKVADFGRGWDGPYHLKRSFLKVLLNHKNPNINVIRSLAQDPTATSSRSNTYYARDEIVDWLIDPQRCPNPDEDLLWYFYRHGSGSNQGSIAHWLVDSKRCPQPSRGLLFFFARGNMVAYRKMIAEFLGTMKPPDKKLLAIYLVDEKSEIRNIIASILEKGNIFTGPQRDITRFLESNPEPTGLHEQYKTMLVGHEINPTLIVFLLNNALTDNYKNTFYWDVPLAIAKWISKENFKIKENLFEITCILLLNKNVIVRKLISDWVTRQGTSEPIFLDLIKHDDTPEIRQLVQNTGKYSSPKPDEKPPPNLAEKHTLRPVNESSRIIKQEEKEDKLKTLANLVKVSRKLKISQVAQILDIGEKELYKHIVEWAVKFGFIIDEEIVDFAQGQKEKFIAQLDVEFKNWEVPKNGKPKEE